MPRTCIFNLTEHVEYRCAGYRIEPVGRPGTGCGCPGPQDDSQRQLPEANRAVPICHCPYPPSGPNREFQTRFQPVQVQPNRTPERESCGCNVDTCDITRERPSPERFRLGQIQPDRAVPICHCPYPPSGANRDYQNRARPVQPNPTPVLETCGCNFDTCGITPLERFRRGQIQPERAAPVICGCHSPPTGANRDYQNRVQPVQAQPVTPPVRETCGCDIIPPERYKPVQIQAPLAQTRDSRSYCDAKHSSKGVQNEEVISVVCSRDTQGGSTPMFTPKNSLVMPTSIERRRKYMPLFSSGPRLYREKLVQTALPIGFKSCECSSDYKISRRGPPGPKVINVKLHLKLIPEQPKIPCHQRSIKPEEEPCDWDCASFGPMFAKMLCVLKDIDVGVHDLKNNQSRFFKMCKDKKGDSRGKNKPKKSAKKQKDRKNRKKDEDTDQEDEDDDNGDDKYSSNNDETDDVGKSDAETTEESVPDDDKSKKSKKDKNKSKDDNKDSKETEKKEKEDKKKEKSDKKTKRQAGGSEFCYLDKGTGTTAEVQPVRGKSLWRKVSSSFVGECFSGFKRRKLNKTVDFTQKCDDDKIVYRWAGCQENASPPILAFHESGMRSELQQKEKSIALLSTEAINHMTSTTALELGRDDQSSSILIRTHNLEEEPFYEDSYSKMGLHGSIPTQNDSSNYTSLESNIISPPTPPAFSSVIAPGRPVHASTASSKLASRSFPDASKKDPSKNKQNRLSGGYDAPSISKPYIDKIDVYSTTQVDFSYDENVHDEMKLSGNIFSQFNSLFPRDVSVIETPSNPIETIKSSTDIHHSKSTTSKSRDSYIIGTEILETILEHIENPESDNRAQRPKIDIESPANAIEEIFARRRHPSNNQDLAEQPSAESSTSEDPIPTSSTRLVTYSKSRRRIWASALLQDLSTGSKKNEQIALKAESMAIIPSVIMVESSIKNDAELPKKL